MINRIESNQRMSKVVIHRDTAYLSGQVPHDRGADFDAQCRSVLQKIDQILVSISSSREQMLSATIYLSDMANFDAMNVLWEQWLPTNAAPARTTVKAQMNTPETLIEITVVAMVDVAHVKQETMSTQR